MKHFLTEASHVQNMKKKDFIEYMVKESTVQELQQLLMILKGGKKDTIIQDTFLNAQELSEEIYTIMHGKSFWKETNLLPLLATSVANTIFATINVGNMYSITNEMKLLKSLFDMKSPQVKKNAEEEGINLADIDEKKYKNLLNDRLSELSHEGAATGAWLFVQTLFAAYQAQSIFVIKKNLTRSKKNE